MRKYKCMKCGVSIEYIPEYCCNDKDCDCEGLPIYPPLCKKCEKIIYGDKINKGVDHD